MSDDKGEKKARLVEAFARGMTYAEAANYAGVSSATVRRWCDADADMKARVDEARDRADDEVEAVTFANCKDPDPAHNTLRMFWLKSRRPQVYRDKVDQQHSGGVTIQVKYDDPHPPPAAPPPRPA